MTPKLYYERTLLFYDVPQVIAMRDELGVHYLGFLLDETVDDLPYAVAPLTPDAFHAVVAGRATYWEGIEPGQNRPCYTVHAVEHDLGRLEVGSAYRFADVPRDNWPDEGAGVLEEDEVRASSLATAYSVESPLLVEVAVDPLDNSLPISHFTSLLTRLQQLVKSILGIGSSKRQLLSVAVPSSPGSFKVLLEQARSLGILYPDVALTGAVNDAASLLRFADNPEGLVGYFETNPDAGSAFKEFVKAVRTIDTGITLRWETSGDTSNAATASRYQMEQLQDWLRGKYEAVTHQVSYKGIFTAVDLKNGKWRLADAVVVDGVGTLDDSSAVGGETLPGSTDLLRHLLTGDAYTFVCTETTSLDPLTSEPSVERILVHIQERTP